MAAICSSPVVSWSQDAQAAAAISGNEKEGKILSDVMATNSYSMLLMKIAMEKAQSQELRDAANRMIADHQRMDARLTATSNRLNLAMDPEQRAKYTSKLSKWDRDKVSTGWDADMIEELVDVHKDGIDMLTDAGAKAQDAELKALIEQSVPIMQQHLDLLMPLKSKVKDGKATAAATPSAVTTDVASDMASGNEKDAKFFSDLRAANLFELRMVEMVFKKSGNRDLKNAAQQMIETHQQLDQRTKEYGTRMRYAIDPDEGSKVAEKLAKWNDKKGGMEWDADIIEEMIDTHADGIDMLEDAQSGVQDEELKKMIQATIPTMKMHVQMLLPLKEKIKKPWKEK